MSQLTFFVPFHVNLFILISGYCGIRRLKGIVKVWKLVFSYLLLVAGLNLMFHWGTFDYCTLFFSLSRNPWWFMQMYALLVLLAPVALEPLISHSTRKEQTILLVVALLIDVYFGYFCRIPSIHHDGYDLLHMTTIYIVGSYLRNFDLRSLSVKGIRLRAAHLFLAFAALMALKFAVHYALVLVGVKDYFMDYNNPFNILLAVTAFAAFLNLNVKSPKVLFVSTSVIGVYLFTGHPLVADWTKDVFNDLIGKQCHGSFPLEVGMMLLFFAVMFIACILIDKIRVYIVSLVERPITAAVNRAAERVMPRWK